MLKVMIGAAAVLSLAATTSADAASKRKRHVVRSAPVVTTGAPVARTPGPSWANPNDCYTDEGYGRYWPCGAGRDN